MPPKGTTQGATQRTTLRELPIRTPQEQRQQRQARQEKLGSRTGRDAQEYATLGVSWRRSLLAENKAPRTIDNYLLTHARFGVYLAAHGLPQRPVAIRREHVEAWLVAMFEEQHYAPRTVANRFEGLHAWFTWLEREEEIAASPMRRMRAPHVPTTHKPVMTDAQVTALLATCSGRSFADRRDLALMMLLFDSGMRRGDLVSITLDHLNLDEQCVVIRAKGRDERLVAFGKQTVRVLDRYLRVRATQLHAQDPHLFIGQHGKMGGTGIYWVLTERAKQAGLEGIHPHRLRHKFTHAFLAAGGQESDVMEQNGWSTTKMVRHYGAALRNERAREAVKRLSPADRMASGG
jgi:integrase/recombinase XerC